MLLLRWSFVALRPERRRAAGLLHLPAARDGERVRRDILGDHAAGGDDRAVADRNRRDERGVRADEGPRPDRSAVLGMAVVIAGDGARADIRPLSDRGVA